MGLLLTALTFFVTAVAGLAAALYIYFKIQYSYWEKRNVPYAKPSFFSGNLTNIGKISMTEAFHNVYKEVQNHKFAGFWIMHRPAMMINDPELVKKVLVQDFSHFQDHAGYFNEKDDPLSAHLFAMEGTPWKNLRAKLSPTFTSGKMKYMFPRVTEVSDEMVQVLQPLADKGELIEAKDLIARFGTDVIASCAFGIQTNSLRNPNSLFREMGRKVFEPTLPVLVKNAISFLLPDLAGFLKLVVTPKDVTEFFMGVVKETMDVREKNNIKRNDFMQLMIQLKNQGFIDDVNDRKVDDNDPFTFEKAAAQAFIFYIGGFETSSGVLQFTLYHLAKQPEIQEKLRREILESLEKTGGKMTYESIHELKYLGMVLSESLRIAAPASFLNRNCTKDYKIPGTDVTIEKGTSVYVAAVGLHYDPRYYPEPEKFDPERFTEENKAERNNYVYLPFGEGPRFCIGQRFAFMQMRVSLIALLSKYRLHLCDQSPKKIVLDPKSLVASPLGGIHLKITRV